jgi:trigger factor
MDGKQFDGGKSDNYNLTLGSHSFIDTFEDQIIGKNIGDEFDVNVTFPEDYGQKELAGKPAVFKVKLNSLKKKELPELDDEFAGEVSEFDTLDEYKKDVEKTIRERKENEAKSAKEDKVVAAIIEKATMEIPEAMIETEQQTTLEQFAQRLRYQGLTFEQYLQFSGQTKKSMLEQVKPEAEKRIKSNLVLKAVAKAENLQATDEEVDAEIEKMGKQYNMKAEDLKKNLGEAELADIKENIVIGKAVDLVRDAAVEA